MTPPHGSEPSTDRQRAPTDTAGVPSVLVIRERTGHVEVLTLNRRESASALNRPLMAELGTALHEILVDDEVRAVVVTGSGERVFCAGMDLSALGQFNEGDDPADPSGARTLAAFMEGSYPKP